MTGGPGTDRPAAGETVAPPPGLRGRLYRRVRATSPRPTLRLRLTLLNGVLLVGAGALLLGLSLLLVRQALVPAQQLQAGSQVTLADGQVVDAKRYQARLARDTELEVVFKGLAALVVISSAGVIGGYIVTGRALRPLTRVTQAARRLSTETMDQRIRYAGPDDEIRELANTYDAMLDRITDAFASQRRFVANASHELRTPLAVMRTEVDVVLADPASDAEELRRMGRVVREASERANSLVESLLLLARTEAQAGRRLVRKVPADLAAGVAVALSAVRPDVARMQLSLQVATPPAPVVGDPSLLERLAGNLIENAVRYNHAGGTLWVRTSTDAEHAYLVVGNSGGELDPGEVPALFEPFRRGGRERTGTRGSGLGLSIVRAVIDAHGGSVSARALSGGGLEVTCTMPAAGVTPVARGAAAPVPRPARTELP
jgi:signal transduction histidine kinase